ncbi:MAG: hypothetical protein GDA50_05295 [Alphaproteobacteria bacterium GM202ARS2]|nr:hypothetical protein [Alphaproteobacteria bacterium GM202ARS2]
MMPSEKRTRGCYYTQGNPFRLEAFVDWATRAQLDEHTILEPFAGCNNLITMLRDVGLCRAYQSYDSAPTAQDVVQRDTLRAFPSGYHVCVTNPPWLARNSATRRGLAYLATRYDDLYKHCLELCLQHCRFVAALVPATFLQSGLFRARLHTYILLHDRGLFTDTDNPVCLALFDAQPSPDVLIYHDDRKIGWISELEAHLPRPAMSVPLRFNDKHGALGFVSFDNTVEPSIRFCPAEEIEAYPVKGTSRFFTRIGGDVGRDVVGLAHALNERVWDMRAKTCDVLLTPFKGLRADGVYRRRMSFALARGLISEALQG